MELVALQSDGCLILMQSVRMLESRFTSPSLTYLCNYTCLNCHPTLLVRPAYSCIKETSLPYPYLTELCDEFDVGILAVNLAMMDVFQQAWRNVIQF